MTYLAAEPSGGNAPHDLPRGGGRGGGPGGKQRETFGAKSAGRLPTTRESGGLVWLGGAGGIACSRWGGGGGRRGGGGARKEYVCATRGGGSRKKKRYAGSGRARYLPVYGPRVGWTLLADRSRLRPASLQLLEEVGLRGLGVSSGASAGFWCTRVIVFMVVRVAGKARPR